MLAVIARILHQLRQISTTPAAVSRRRRLVRSRRAGILVEPMESRTLLSANPIATVVGSLTLADPAADVRIEVSSTSELPQIGFSARSLTDGLSLNPIELRTDFGVSLDPNQSNSNGLEIQHALNSGFYRSRVSGRDGGIGEFEFSVSLVGDLDGSGSVGERDIRSIVDRMLPTSNGFAGSLRRLLDVQALDSVFAADINLDGNVNLQDVESALTNVGADLNEVTLTVQPVNSAPVLDNSGSPAFDDIDESQTEILGLTVAEILARSANGDPITDANPDALDGIAVIGLSALGGTWEFDVTGGTDFVEFGDVSESSATLLTPEARIRFNPTSQFSGTVQEALTFRAWDQTAGNNGDEGISTVTNGGETPFSVVTETVSLTVDPLELTLDFSAANVIQGADPDLLITNQSSVEIRGTTAANATVQVDRDGDGLFDDGTTTAGADGSFTVTVNLAHDDVNFGQNDLVVRAIGANLGLETEQEQSIHRAIGTVTRFTTNLGAYDVELLDDAAPETVANFLNYEDRYVDSIVHRSPADFVIQGGGFTASDADDPILQAIPTDAPVDNAFDAANRNLRGTLSTAQQGGDIDSFTSQWFVNVSNNTFLDDVPHTVFGRVLGNGMELVDEINNLPIFNIVGTFDDGALGELPLIDYTAFTEPLSGTVSVANGGTLVLGTNTAFTTEILRAGGQIQLSGQTFLVSQVISDTELLINNPLTGGLTDGTAFVNATPSVEQFVRFSSISPILAPAP